MKYFILIALCFFLKSQAAKTAFFEDIYSKKLVLCKKTKEISSDKSVDNIIYYKKNNFYYKRIYKHLTPEMFGAKGDGVSDDYKAIQEMLDKGEEGCIFYFDGKKTYYNAFANKGLWIEPLKRNIWQRHKSATFLFNGSKLRRRLPEWNDKNEKGNYNEGKFYTDDHTALLYLTGKNYVIENADFNSGVQLGNLLDTDEKPTNIFDYAVGTCMEMGLWLDHCDNVTVNNSQFSNSVFPIYVTYGNNLKFSNITLKYAAQANRRINPNDPAIGGGIKLMNCSYVSLDKIYGFRNLNDTVEIETENNQISVNGKSDYDYDNSLVIIASQNIKINWEANNIMHGTGLLIIGDNNKNMETKNISGNVKIEKTSWCGVLIWLREDAVYDINNINLNIKSSKTHYTGLYLNNESKIKAIKNIKINHNSSFDGIGTGFSRIINNDIQGDIKGTTNNSNAGLLVKGIKKRNLLKTDIKIDNNVKIKYQYK